ncbi:MAG: hypothetical protein REI94_19845 [Moraxellaceae bacterium]|nr:hypothetical protein [Moraxellaceae bacterium]
MKRFINAGFGTAVVLVLSMLALAACATPLTENQKRVQEGYALFQKLCKEEAGLKIYRKVEGVEGVVLLRVKQRAGDKQWADPLWPDAAFAHEGTGDEYIKYFLLSEEPAMTFRENNPRPITAEDRGDFVFWNTPRPGYKYVDVVEEQSGVRWRYALLDSARKERNGGLPPHLKRELAPSERPRYGVTYETPIIPEEREKGVARGVVKMIDLDTNELLGEMRAFSWTMSKPTSSNPSPWLTGPSCSIAPTRSRIVRISADQALIPKKRN